MHWAVFGAALAASTAMALAAHAEPTPSYSYLNPGYVVTHAKNGESSITGHGVELSFMHYPRGSELGYGGFGQAFAYSADDARYSVGVQGGDVVGAEAGFTYRTAHGAIAETPGAHLALYASLGFVTIAARSSIAFFTRDGSGRPTSGNETALTLGFKFPILVDGRGRPLPLICRSDVSQHRAVAFRR